MKRSNTILIFLLLNSIFFTLSAQTNDANPGDGLTGYYYQSYIRDDTTGTLSFDDLTLSFSRVDTTINFWDGNRYFGWAPVSGWGNNYSVLWTGYIYINEPGLYGFGTISDDGSQVFIDSVLIVNNSDFQWYDWEDNISEGDPDDTLPTSFPPLELETGFHFISVSFFENASYDGIELWWLTPGADSSDIPYYGTNFHGTAPTYNQNTTWEIVPKSVLFTLLPTAINEDYQNSYNIPGSFELFQNYPNPFNPVTTIRYSLPVTCNTDLSVYNIRGQKVVTLVSKIQTARTYEMEWDASAFSSGVYIYRLSAGEQFSYSQKCILIK